MSSVVALVKGSDRLESIGRALELISGDIHPGRRIVVKPNFVSTERQVAATHVDAVRAVLQFLQERGHHGIVVADGASFSDTMNGYRNFGYLSLREEFGVELIDLNRDEWMEIEAYDRRLRTMKLRMSRTLADSDYVISVTPPKTHDTVVVTLSLKNVIMGGLIREQKEGGSAGHRPGKIVDLSRIGSLIPPSLRDLPALQSVRDFVNRTRIKSDKLAMHQGFPVINLNLYKLAAVVKPHLSVIDGTIGMEGNGPIMGTGVDLGTVIASTDFLAADSLAVHIMGFRLKDVGYLHYCSLAGMGVSDVSEMEIRGEKVEDCVLPFRPHHTYKDQLKWRDESLKDLVPQRSV